MKNLQFVRRRLEALVAERFTSGSFSPEQQAEFERLCEAEQRLLHRRNGDFISPRG